MRNALGNDNFKNVLDLYRKQEQLWLNSDMSAVEILNARQAFVAAYEQDLTPVFDALFNHVQPYNITPEIGERLEQVKAAGAFNMVMDFSNYKVAKLKKAAEADPAVPEETKGKINTIQAIVRNAEGTRVTEFRESPQVKADPFENSGLSADQIKGLKEFHKWLNRNCDKSGFEYFGSNGSVRSFADKFMRMPLNQQLEALYLVQTNKRKNPEAMTNDDIIASQQFIPRLPDLKNRMVAHWTKFWRRSDGSQFYWNKLQQAMNIAERHDAETKEARRELAENRIDHVLEESPVQAGKGIGATTVSAIDRIKDYNGQLLLKYNQIESGIKQNMNLHEYLNGKLTDETLKDAPKTFYSGEKYFQDGLKAVDAVGAGYGLYKAGKELLGGGKKTVLENTVNTIGALKSTGLAAYKLGGATVNLTTYAIGEEAMKETAFIGNMAGKLKVADKLVPTAIAALDTAVDVVKIGKGFDKNKHLNRADALIDDTRSLDAKEKINLKEKVDMLKRINKRKMATDKKNLTIDGTLLTVVSIGLAVPVVNVATAGVVSVAKLAFAVESNLYDIEAAKQSRGDVLETLDKIDDDRMKKFSDRFNEKYELYEREAGAKRQLDDFRDDPERNYRISKQIHNRNAVDVNSTTLNNYVDKKVDQFADEIASNVYGKTLDEYNKIQQNVAEQTQENHVIHDLKSEPKKKHDYVSHLTYKEMLKGTGTKHEAIETNDEEKYKEKYGRRKDKIAKNIKNTILQK